MRGISLAVALPVYPMLRQIQKSLSGYSDSEVAVTLYSVYGTPGFLQHLRGEFAFVLYDEEQQKVIAIRDRFSIKPLFWTAVGDGGGTLLLASEAKAFLPLGWKPESASTS
ncbi:uncharacterized protein PpBr36_09933 [Pyricularia pennisetigena]|uniref:uncharacterized protein n=1 Tax=Pyricularia pennisetigena TaxID=1578925 RepID=UPI0011530043|nr:uncharacterized protein PpBr36_09933 [Pyricularia pennisetigena]TLS22398.1 hypothetical protein PpBr36_09933 [Pyricularia pennisetigena]